MGRIFVIVGGFLVLLLTAALVIPPFINWTGYRAAFEREASRIMGREVHVRGTASARLLPFPSVSFSDVFVGSKDDTTTLSVEKFSIDAELMPFLRGEILIFDMQVKKPVLQINLDEKGRVDWARHEDALLNNAQVKVEKLTVSDGRILIADGRTGREHQVQNIEAVLSARNITGPWQMNASLESEGQKFALDLSTGELKPDGALRVRSRIKPDNIAVSFETDGDMTIRNGLLNYTGHFHLQTPETSTEKKSEKPGAKGDRVQEISKSLLNDLRIEGMFKASGQQFVIDEFRMEQGTTDAPYVVNGKAQFDYGDNPHFEISADGQQFSFGGSAGEQSGEAVPLQEPLKAFRKFIDNIPLPSIPGSVDLSLPAIVAGGTTIRTITIVAIPEGQGWKIKEFSADLPGRTRVEAQGFLGLGDQFGFEGHLLVASRQPSGLVGWLTADIDETVRQLSGIGLSGKVILNDRIQQIDDLEIGLDDTSLTGSFYRQVLEGGVPSIDLDLHSKKISNAALRMMMSSISSVEGITAFGNQALNVSLKADSLALGTSETGALDARFRFGNGGMDFDRFMLQDLNGATVTAAGNFVPHQDELTGTIDATLLSDDLADFISWLHHILPEQPLVQGLFKRSLIYPDLFSQSKINFIGSTVIPLSKANIENKDQATVSEGGLSSETSFSVNGVTGRIQLDFSGMAAGQWASEEGLQIQLNGRAKSKEGEQILALLGLPVLPLGLVGELEADVALQGALNIGVRTQIQLQAPDAKAGFDGVVTVLADDVTASGKAHIKAENIEPFLASMGYSLPGFGLGFPVEVTSDVQFAKSILRLPNLHGSLSDNKISAKLEALKPENANSLLRGELDADEADLQFLSEVMLGTDAFISRKNSWPQQKFLRRPMLPFSFDLNVKATVADVGQYGVIKDFSAKMTKADDQLGLSDMRGDWQGGQISGQAQLRNSEGNALFSGDMSWKGFDLAEAYQLNSLNGYDAFLGGKASVTATLQGSGESVADIIKSLSGSTRFVVDDLTVHGLNVAQLPKMLEQADQDEAATSKNMTKRFVAIAEQATREGVFLTSDAQFDFMIAGGVARMGLTRLENSQAILESEMQIDLSDMGLNGNSRLTYKISDGTILAGSHPSIGMLLSGTYNVPQVKIDYQPLVQFLTQRALEREQERVEAMQAALREKQSLRREAERLKAQIEARDRVLAETEIRNKAEAQKRERARLKREFLEQERMPEGQRKILEDVEEIDNAPDNMESIGQSVEEFLKDLDAPR